jgi:hypothetical protein
MTKYSIDTLSKLSKVTVDTQKWHVWANPVRPPWSKSLKGNLDVPLDRSRRVDQDPYIEGPIRSPNERDMASGRSPRHPGG